MKNHTIYVYIYIYIYTYIGRIDLVREAFKERGLSEKRLLELFIIYWIPQEELQTCHYTVA
jgi:hypothetical protein